MSEDMIRARSYQIWLNEGCPDGKAVEHWLRAEAELEAERQTAPIEATTSARLSWFRPPIMLPPKRLCAGKAAA